MTSRVRIMYAHNLRIFDTYKIPEFFPCHIMRSSHRTMSSPLVLLSQLHTLFAAARVSVYDVDGTWMGSHTTKVAYHGHHSGMDSVVRYGVVWWDGTYRRLCLLDGSKGFIDLPRILGYHQTQANPMHRQHTISYIRKRPAQQSTGSVFANDVKVKAEHQNHDKPKSPSDQ